MAILSKFGNYLVGKGIFDVELVSKATQKVTEYGDNSPAALANVMVKEFGVNHDEVFEALSRLYAFPRKEIDTESLTAEEIQASKDLLKKIPEDFKKKLLYRKIFPYKISEKGREVLTVLASDTTDKLIQDIASLTPFKKYEVFWCKLRTIEDLIARLSPQKTSFWNFWKKPDRSWWRPGAARVKGWTSKRWTRKSTRACW